MRLFLLISIIFSFSWSVYLSNKSCKECHKDIYNEYQRSYHSKGYFNDILHRYVSDKISTKKYDCATCHMPSASNIKNIINGTSRPKSNNITQKDAISCFFCHAIAYVKKSHKFNINVSAKQAEDYKPTMYGTLNNPDENDKHSSVNNPLYEKNVCLGCHSHKRNQNDLLIFQAINSSTNVKECIKCHMPKIPGGNENMNKRGRLTHHSHYFEGIHSYAMRKKAVKLNLKINLPNSIKITLKNKMSHPLIIQSSREMYLRAEIKRGNKIIWSNKKDKQAYFKYDYLRNGKPIVIPYTATSYSFANNLKAKKEKIFNYKTPKLNKGDKVIISFYMIIAKKDCIDDVGLKNSGLDKPILTNQLIKILKNTGKN